MNKIAQFIVYNKVAAYVAALLCVVVWVLDVLGQGRGVVPGDSFGLLLSIIAGYLSVKVGRELSFDDVKSGLPATLFFMGCALAPGAIFVGSDAAHWVLFPVACYILLRTYRDRSAMGRYFLAFALVGVECMLAPTLVMVLPLVVLCGAFMDSLHWRTFFAALWGLLFPYWVVGSVLFLIDRTGLIAQWLGGVLPPVSAVSVVPAPQFWAGLLWALLLAAPGSVMIMLDRTMRQQTSAGFRMLIAVLVLMLAALFLFPSFHPVLFPCVLLDASLIGSLFFARGVTRGKNIYLVMLLIGWLSFLIYAYGTTV